MNALPNITIIILTLVLATFNLRGEEIKETLPVDHSAQPLCENINVTNNPSYSEILRINNMADTRKTIGISILSSPILKGYMRLTERYTTDMLTCFLEGDFECVNLLSRTLTLQYENGPNNVSDRYPNSYPSLRKIQNGSLKTYFSPKRLDLLTTLPSIVADQSFSEYFKAAHELKDHVKQNKLTEADNRDKFLMLYQKVRKTCVDCHASYRMPG